MAEPNPPLVFGPKYPALLQSGASITAAPSAEWTYHRTADGQHPNGDEQALVWLMNRARRDPAAEGQWLATESNADVASGRVFFQVNTTLLQSEFASYAAKPPAAFDARLYQAAKAHSNDLIARDAQDHNQQFDRITSAGFRYTQARAGVFSYAKSALNAHAAWNIDWGPGDGTGMQPGRGHRLAVMAITPMWASPLWPRLIPPPLWGRWSSLAIIVARPKMASITSMSFWWAQFGRIRIKTAVMIRARATAA
jgi:hypothetical protein